MNSKVDIDRMFLIFFFRKLEQYKFNNKRITLRSKYNVIKRFLVDFRCYILKALLIHFFLAEQFLI